MGKWKKGKLYFKTFVTDNPEKFIRALKGWVGRRLSFEIYEGEGLILYEPFRIDEYDWRYKGDCCIVLIEDDEVEELYDDIGEGILEGIEYDGERLIVIMRRR